jgi:hypothetical protein
MKHTANSIHNSFNLMLMLMFAVDVDAETNNTRQQTNKQSTQSHINMHDTSTEKSG